MLRMLALLAFLFAAGTAHSQVPPPVELPVRTLSPAQLREDFKRLRFTLQRAHPHLHRYATAAAMNARFDQLEGGLAAPMTDLDFFRLLAPLIDGIRDEHTSLHIPDELRKHFSSSKRPVFPLDLRYELGRPTVEADLQDRPGIPPGSILISIDDRPMDEVTWAIAAPISIDGYSYRTKLEGLNSSFWYYYGVTYGNAATYRVVVQDPRTRRQSTHVIAGVSPLRLAQRGARKRPAQRLDLGPDRIAVMTLDELTSEATGDFLRTSFARIADAKVQDLIIDLRDCPGGNDKFNNQLISFLTDQPFRFYTHRTFVARSYDDLRYVDYDLSDFITAEQQALLPETQRQSPLRTLTLRQLLTFMLSADGADGTFRPSRTSRFSGRLYWLFSPRSSSSAAEIAAIAHHLGLGTIVGDEPNGDYAGVSGGSIPVLKLPNSRIAVSIPLVAYHNAVMPGLFPGRGAPPAFPISQTLSDTLAGVDSAMAFTRNLILARRLEPIASNIRQKLRSHRAPEILSQAGPR